MSTISSSLSWHPLPGCQPSTPLTTPMHFTNLPKTYSFTQNIQGNLFIPPVAFRIDFSSLVSYFPGNSILFSLEKVSKINDKEATSKIHGEWHQKTDTLDFIPYVLLKKLNKTAGQFQYRFVIKQDNISLASTVFCRALDLPPNTTVNPALKQEENKAIDKGKNTEDKEQEQTTLSVKQLVEINKILEIQEERSTLKQKRAIGGYGLFWSSLGNPSVTCVSLIQGKNKRITFPSDDHNHPILIKGAYLFDPDISSFPLDPNMPFSFSIHSCSNKNVERYIWKVDIDKIRELDFELNQLISMAIASTAQVNASHFFLKLTQGKTVLRSTFFQLRNDRTKPNLSCSFGSHKQTNRLKPYPPSVISEASPNQLVEPTPDIPGVNELLSLQAYGENI